MCTELYRGRGWRRGSPRPQSSDSALSAPVGSPCPHFKEQSTRAFPSWVGLECGSPCLTLSAVGQLSAQITSEVWGTQISGVSFGFIDPGHGPENKTVSLGIALEDLLATTLSPKTGGSLRLCHCLGHPAQVCRSWLRACF